MESVKTPSERPAAVWQEKSFHEKSFEVLYERAFPAFARFASKMNASFDDARDIFHDALVIYYEKSVEDDGLIRLSPEGYVVGIAKHLWIRKYKRDRHKISLNERELSISVPSDFYATVNESKLLAFLERAGKRCLELLQKFYYEKTPLKTIAAALGYGTEHSAAVQKFKCIGKVRNAIKSKSMEYEDFLF
jgi:RNA polymerase sigma factor (sigma-70 family)